MEIRQITVGVLKEGERVVLQKQVADPSPAWGIDVGSIGVVDYVTGGDGVGDPESDKYMVIFEGNRHRTFTPIEVAEMLRGVKIKNRNQTNIK